MKRKINDVSSQRRALWASRQRFGMELRHPSSAVVSNLGTRLPPAKKKGRWIKRTSILILLMIAVSAGVFGYKIIATGDKITVADRSIFGQLKDLLFSNNNVLAGEEAGRVNVLLIAVGGEGHNGEQLADTIMLASIRPSDNTAALLSIPRDLYVQVPDKEYFTKINAVHAQGEAVKKDHGPALLAGLVEEITGQPVHYFIRVDFTAFKNIVDAVGGVNIAIENSFFDFWHKISFPAGNEKMNGERALAFVRARYVEGPEGGDFKRAARQQQVLLAIRDKVFSYQTALDFSKINGILNSLSDNIRTNLELWELKKFYELARSVNHDQIKSTVLSTGPTGVLVGETQVLGGVPASILKTRTGNYAEIQSIAANIFDSSGAVTPPPVMNEITPETTPGSSDNNLASEPPAAEAEPDLLAFAAKPTVEIRNTTAINGLASRTRDKLRNDDYTITAIGNADLKNQAKTVLYIINDDFTAGATPLAQSLGATIETSLPDEEASTQADVLILLGQDQQEE